MEDENRNIELKNILKEKDLNKTLELIKQNKWKELRVYLNTLDYLLVGEVLPDYLYYFLEYKFKN